MEIEEFKFEFDCGSWLDRGYLATDIHHRMENLTQISKPKVYISSQTNHRLFIQISVEKNIYHIVNAWTVWKIEFTNLLALNFNLISEALAKCSHVVAPCMGRACGYTEVTVKLAECAVVCGGLKCVLGLRWRGLPSLLPSVVRGESVDFGVLSHSVLMKLKSFKVNWFVKTNLI